VVEIRGLIRELGKSHTVIFSSHILQEVQQLCSRVIILHEGRMARDVDLTAIQSHPRKWRLTVAMNEKKLAPSLSTLPGVTRLKVLPTFDTAVTEAILESDSEDLPRRLFTLLCGLDAPILRLTPMADTLEEIFLEATASREEVRP